MTKLLHRSRRFRTLDEARRQARRLERQYTGAIVIIENDGFEHYRVYVQESLGAIKRIP